jgi:hypothetical protein
MWDALGPNVETRAFEDAADRVRAEAVQAAASLSRLDAAVAVRLNESRLGATEDYDCQQGFLTTPRAERSPTTWTV